MLRAAADNGNINGVPLNNNDIMEGTVFTNKHQVVLKNADWDETKITVTAIVWEKTGNNFHVVNSSSAIFQP
ncbi:MAG: hypothetical protein ACPGLV_09100 [Bacteroidia bacterium]